MLYQHAHPFSLTNPPRHFLSSLGPVRTMQALLARITNAFTELQDAPMDIRVIGTAGPDIGAVDAFARKGLYENPMNSPFVELQKTHFELDMINCTVRALNGIRVALRLPPLYLPANRIHVFDRPEFDRTFPDHTDSLGLSLGTHAYIPRFDNRRRFASSVTHEITHLTCYKRYRVEVQVDPDDDESGRGVSTSPARMGLRTGKTSFEGLNEAVTEILASAVREELLEMRAPLTKSEKNDLIEWTGYTPQIELFETLTEQVCGSVVRGFTIALWDYLTGTNCFLRILNQEMPGSVAIMRKMGPQPMDALVAAKELGFEDFADRFVIEEKNVE